MRIAVQKWGNSLAIRIPKTVAIETKIARGSVLNLRLAKGKVVLEPAAPEGYQLEILLARVTEDNLHGEVDTGGPVGRESW